MLRINYANPNAEALDAALQSTAFQMRFGDGTWNERSAIAQQVCLL